MTTAAADSLHYSLSPHSPHNLSWQLGPWDSPSTPTPTPTPTPWPPLQGGVNDTGGPAGPSLASVLQGVATFRVAMTLVRWLFPLVVGVGVVGNALSLWVLLRRGMRRTSACRYLACLAVADLVVLLVSALKTWVRVMWDFELLHVSGVTCKLFIFLTHLSLMAAAWLTVAVTLERFLAVWMPLRATELCSVGRTRVVVVSLLALLAFLNGHVFWTAELLPVSPQRSLSPSGVQCASYAYQTLACRVFPWVHLVLYCFVPAGLLLVLNTLLLYKLFQHRQAITASQDSKTSRSSGSNRHTANGNHACPAVLHSHRPPPRNRSHTRLLKSQSSVVVATTTPRPSSASSSQTPQHFHRRLAPMLLGVSFSWVVLTTPQTLYGLATPPPQDMEEVGQQYLVKTVCYLLMYVNHAVHFFLYCLTGQRFRQELKRGLLCSDSERSGRVKRALQHKWPDHDHHLHHHHHPPSRQGDGEGEEEEEGEGEGEGTGDSGARPILLKQHTKVVARFCECPLMDNKLL